MFIGVGASVLPVACTDQIIGFVALRLCKRQNAIHDRAGVAAASEESDVRKLASHPVKTKEPAAGGAAGSQPWEEEWR